MPPRERRLATHRHVCRHMACCFSFLIVLQNKGRVVRVARGHVVVVATFAAFAVANGGIVVGDRDAHRPTLHLAQLPYFCLFSAAAFAPLWLPSSMCASDPCFSLPGPGVRLVSILVRFTIPTIIGCRQQYSVNSLCRWSVK